MLEPELRDSVIRLTTLVETLGDQGRDINTRLGRIDALLTDPEYGFAVRLKLVEEGHRSLRTTLRVVATIVITNIVGVFVGGATWAVSRLVGRQ